MLSIYLSAAPELSERLAWEIPLRSKESLRSELEKFEQTIGCTEGKIQAGQLNNAK